MTLTDVEIRLNDEIKTGFEANSIAYTLENAPEGFVAQENETERVDCEINFLSSSQASMGNEGTRLFRRRGDVLMRVHTKVRDGVRRKNQIADIILSLFEGKSFGGIVTETIGFLRIGPIGDWYITTVRIPFYFNIEDI